MFFFSSFETSFSLYDEDDVFKVLILCLALSKLFCPEDIDNFLSFLIKFSSSFLGLKSKFFFPEI